MLTYILVNTFGGAEVFSIYKFYTLNNVLNFINLSLYVIIKPIKGIIFEFEQYFIENKRYFCCVEMCKSRSTCTCIKKFKSKAITI